MKKSSLLFVAFCCLLVGSRARADIPPPRDSLRDYRVAINPDMSALLLASTQFQERQLVKLRFGKVECDVWQDSWKSDDKSIECLETNWCFGKPMPACTVNLISGSNAEFVKVEQATPLSGDIEPANDVIGAEPPR